MGVDDSHDVLIMLRYVSRWKKCLKKKLILAGTSESGGQGGLHYVWGMLHYDCCLFGLDISKEEGASFACICSSVSQALCSTLGWLE